MSQDLFNGLKVGIFLDAVTPGTENRKNGETKIVTLSCRVEPFTADLATAIDDGVHAKHQIKPLLYNMTDAEPKSIVERLAVRLGCPRQRVLLFASSDTVVESLALQHVRIGGITVRTSKDANGYVLTFKASFGPVGKAELEYLHDWYLGQRFAKFDQAEPSLEFSAEGATEDTTPSDADEKARQAAPGLTWDDKPADAPAAGDAPTSVVEQEQGQRTTLHTGRGGRRNRRESPDVEARRQREAGAQVGDVDDDDVEEQVAH
jgi:hypothetical protein